MPYASHLLLQEGTLPASSEQAFEAAGWCLLRLSAGVGYCFAGREAIDLGTGDLVIAPPLQPFLFRASQLGPATFHWCHFEPEYLGAFLTLPERQRFVALARLPDLKLCRLAAAHEISAQFATICEGYGEQSPFLERCLILASAAMFFTPRLNALEIPLPTPHFTAQARFLEWVRKTPETEMVMQSPAELARLCRCAVARFRRMFRSHFGVSFRSKKAQSRLEKARRLLMETDVRIGDVAVACGYKSRKVFNEMFKKHFGQRPSDVRRCSGPAQTPGRPAA